MKKKALVGFALGMVMLNFAGVSQATLFDRGGGLIYDDVLNITWLQDANYAKTSGFSSNGVFRADQALNWASNLVYHDSVRNVNYDDWRLPSVSPIGMDWNYEFSTDGSTDWGPNNTSTQNELSYMYFVNLGLESFISVTGQSYDDFGIFSNGTTTGQNDISVGSLTIQNLQASSYWTGTRWELPESGIYYWTFFTGYGETNAAYEYTAQYAWAVRDGDVAPVPEPATMFLMGTGLAGLIAARRKKKA